MLLLLLVFARHLVAQPCTYTAFEWAQVACGGDTVLNFTLCDTAWCALLQVPVAGLVQPQNRLWVLGAQQYIAASMNAQQAHFVDPTGEVEYALIYIGASLDAACGNVSQWQLTDSLAASLSTLYALNHRAVGACPPLNTTPSSADTFYYTQPPYLMTLRDTVSNMTMSYSALANIYGTQQALVVTNIVQFVVIVLCVLKIIIDRNDRRTYMWMLRQANPCLEPGVANDGSGAINGDEDGVELSSMEDEVYNTGDTVKQEV